MLQSSSYASNFAINWLWGKEPYALDKHNSTINIVPTYPPSLAVATIVEIPWYRKLQS